MPDTSPLLHRIPRLQPGPVHCPFPSIRIHREISDLKRHQVLKEMTALRRNDTEIPKTCLHNHPRPRNLIPFHRNSQPQIVRPQPSHSNQNVRFIFQGQLSIKVPHPLRNFLPPPPLKPLESPHPPTPLHCHRTAHPPPPPGHPTSDPPRRTQFNSSPKNSNCEFAIFSSPAKN